jgi:hypothetical protein
VVVLLGAWACSKEPAPGDQIRISPPGQGKVIHFNIEPKPSEPILVSSSDVQSQRGTGDSLLVNFDKLVMALNPETKVRYVTPTNVSVQVGPRIISGRIQSPLTSRFRSAGLFGIDRDKPRGSIGPFQVEVHRAGPMCDSGCVLSVIINYNQVIPATTISRSETIPGVAESAPVSIQLLTGSVITATDAAPVRPQAARVECPLLGSAEASRLLGVEVKPSQAGPQKCKFDVVKGDPLFLSITIDAETTSFYEMTTAQGAEMVDIGDRALWLPTGILHVIDKKRRITIQIENPNPKAHRRAAEEIARTVLKKS